MTNEDVRNVIRPARVGDIARIQEIERRAGQAFTAIDMDAIADDDPPGVGELTRYIAAARAWVAAEENDVAAAYVLVGVIDNNAHIEQITVAPENARQGLGATLIQHVDAWARAQRLEGLTLTTFTEVAWNAPYYERLGFLRLAPETLTEGLQRVRAHEAEIGLDRWPRTAMARRF